jgi:hypothetical protein
MSVHSRAPARAVPVIVIVLVIGFHEISDQPEQAFLIGVRSNIAIPAFHSSRPSQFRRCEKSENHEQFESFAKRCVYCIIELPRLSAW